MTKQFSTVVRRIFALALPTKSKTVIQHAAKPVAQSARKETAQLEMA